MTSNKLAAIIVLSALIFAVSLVFQSGSSLPAPSKDNVSIVDGKQIVEITAKGGYAPERSLAKAGVPTILRVTTRGTFDCSSSIRIPSLGVSRGLPQTGTTDIDLGTPVKGTLQGSCGMGMYPFAIEFQ